MLVYNDNNVDNDEYWCYIRTAIRPEMTSIWMTAEVVRRLASSDVLDQAR